MNSYHLKYFIDAAKQGNLGDSARVNLVTHSAISQAIRNLEQDLGVSLLVHRKRHFELTDEGHWLLQEGQIFLSEWERIRGDAKGLGNRYYGELKIAAPQSLISDHLWNPIVKIKKLHSQLNVKLFTGAAQFVKEKVQDGVVNIGCLLDDEDLRLFGQEKISSGNFLLVSKKKDEKLDQAKFLVTQYNKIEVQKFLERYRKHFGHSPHIEMEILSWTLIKKFVANSESVGFLPDYVVANEIRKKTLFKHDFSKLSLPSYEIKAIWKRGTLLSKNSRLFVDASKAQALVKR